MKASISKAVLRNEKVWIPCGITHASENYCTEIRIQSQEPILAKKRNKKNDHVDFDWQNAPLSADPKQLDGHGTLYEMGLWINVSQAMGGTLANNSTVHSCSSHLPSLQCAIMPLNSFKRVSFDCKLVSNTLIYFTVTSAITNHFKVLYTSLNYYIVLL
jgi:hypothetical protein